VRRHAHRARRLTAPFVDRMGLGRGAVLHFRHTAE